MNTGNKPIESENGLLTTIAATADGDDIEYVLGAAYLAGLATGYWESKEDIISNWNLGRKFTPSMEAEYREKLLKGWKKAVKCALIWAEEE